MEDTISLVKAKRGLFFWPAAVVQRQMGADLRVLGEGSRKK